MTMGIDDERAAVNSLVPNNKSHIKNGVIVTWESEETQPTQSEINAEMIRLQAAYDTQAYARSRKLEYDALNQLEMQYDDKVNDTTTWEDAILAIKDKYPKP